MHEGSITQSIIDTVLEAVAAQEKPCTVAAVHVTVGVCQGLVPESMQMFFDMQKPDTPLENSELVVTTQGMEANCPECGADHILDVPVMFCPDCGAPMTLTKGKEILVTSIEVNES